MKGFDGIRGVNYIASYAPDATRMWTEFDRRTVAFELGLARSLGLNAVRVWLSSDAYFQDRARFVEAFDRFVDLCGELGLAVLPILFDSCGVRAPEGQNRLVKVRERYAAFLRDENVPKDVRDLWSGMLGGFIEVTGDVLCQAGGNHTAIFWQEWKSNPGYGNLGADTRGRYRDYVDALVDGHRRDERIALWDVMNEPEIHDIMSGSPDDPLPFEFARHYCDYVRRRDCGIPITVGCGCMPQSLRLKDAVDVLSFHTYELPDVLADRVADARRVAGEEGKPVVLTECLGVLATVPDVVRTLGPQPFSDDGQLRYVQEAYAPIAASGIGWCLFTLMAGGNFCADTGLFYPNGTARPAARWLRRALP